VRHAGGCAEALKEGGGWGRRRRVRADALDGPPDISRYSSEIMNTSPCAFGSVFLTGMITKKEGGEESKRCDDVRPH